MNTQMKGAAKRLILSLLVAVSASGCAYYAPYGAYDPYYYGYSQPYYVGPPISLDLGFGFYDYHGGGHRGGGWGRGWGHGGRGHGGWGHGGWGHGGAGRGGWGGGHFGGRR